MARIYRATINGTHADGTLAQPTLHYQTDLADLGQEPAADDVASGIWSLIGTNYLQCLSTNFTVHELVVGEEVLKPNIGVSGVYAVNKQGTTFVGADDSPHACVAVINRHTGTRSRSARGWLRMPSIQKSAHMVGDIWDDTYKNLLINFASLLDNFFTIGTVQYTTVRPVVYSRTRHVRQQSPWTFNVTSATVNPKVHWLRSRMTNP